MRHASIYSQFITDEGDLSMTTVQPEGEDLRKAVKWISEERKFNPEAQTSKLIEQACLKFDLSPMDAEYLLNFLKQDKK